jgi:PIN domain nuclease of toxin-antitoxin system
MKPAVLDASALLALLLDEPGADMVADHLDGACISTVNLAEAGAKMVERGAGLDLVEREVHAAAITVVPFDVEQALEAARLRPATKAFGLSLGDRACLALAKRMDGVALTSDAAWAEPDLGIEIRLIR